jgi:uncharacterized protein (DUF362 family)
MNRREFVCTSFGAALAAQAPAAAKSRVVVARDATAPDAAHLAALLDRAVQAFYNRDTAAEAWKQAVRPGEVIGLKVNCLAGRGSASTSPVLVEAVSERLRQAGIAAKDILVFDRLTGDLESAGFHIADRPGRTRIVGNDALGYEDELAVFGSAGSLLAKALTRVCDGVINLPVLKDHSITGVTIALKNFFGAIHNPNKYHPNAGDPYIADVYMLPPIRKKVRLAICDALAPQYEGGPSYMPQWSWKFNGLLVARDPVALDYTGWRIVERERAARGMKTLEADHRRPSYIATAADANHRIGTNDPRRIERVEV